MPVDSKHPEYSIRHAQWRRCRDAIGGSDVVKDAGMLYLPSLSGASDKDYEAYKSRALFFNASQRTLAGLVGAVFRKDYTIAIHERFQFLEQVVTSDGLPLHDFARQSLIEILTTGRVGILADVAMEGDQRAYLALYSAEKIINWRTAMIGGRQRLVQVVLEERYSEASDEWEAKSKIQYRVLSLSRETSSAPLVYRQRVYRQGDGKEWSLVPDLSVTPTRTGVPLDYIPFQFINAYHLTPRADRPPLLDLVDVNLSHYRTSADLEHGAHFTALPTAVLTGFPTDKEFRIGSGVAWVADNPGASAQYLEYKGQGLQALRDLKKDKEQMMAVLGARMLEEQKRAAEAADTLRIRQSGEEGSLAAIVGTLSEGLQIALKVLGWWSGMTDEQVVDLAFSLSTDFSPVKLSPQELRELVAAWQAGAISQDTFLYNLQLGEMLQPDDTIEDEKARIAAEGAADGDGMPQLIPVGRGFEA